MTGLELRMLRDGAGLSRAALASLVGVSEQTVWRWETERTRIKGLALVALVSVLRSEATRSQDEESASGGKNGV